MRLDDRKLGIGELARLVEDLDRYRRFAEVVQQAGDAGRTHFFFVETKLPGERDHQRADGHRVHVGVIVGGLQARQADQCARAAAHRVGYLLDQSPRSAGVDGPAHSRFREH
jgi:hypothetical protein